MPMPGPHRARLDLPAENAFLPADFRSSDRPERFRRPRAEIQHFLELGMDGFFTDQSDIGVRARNEFLSR